MSLSAAVLQGEIRKTRLDSLLKCCLDDCHSELQSVLEEGVDGRDESRGQALLKFIHNTRQRLLRVRVLLTHPIRLRHSGACKSIDWLAALERHQHMLSDAADTLFHNHQFFSYAIPVPIFDVASALTIRSRGYLPLPACIGQLDSVPKPPSGRKRALLETEANALVFRLLHQSQWPRGLTLIEVEKGQALLGSDAGYEVAMLLEPAPPSPLAVIVEAVQNLLKPLSTPGKPAEAESAPPGSEQAARAGTASHRGTPSPSDTTAVAAQTAANSIGTAADAAAQGSTAQPPTTDAPADSSARLSQEVILEHLGSLGFTEETFADLQPRWRWRLINLAVSAGSGAGHCMTLSQLHFLRAELDFRMLHGRHAAMTHHLARLIWLQLSAAELEDAADAVGGAAGAGARQDGVGGAVKIVDDGVKGMDVDTVAGVAQQQQQCNGAEVKNGLRWNGAMAKGGGQPGTSGHTAVNGGRGAAGDGGEISNASDGSLQAGAGGSVDKCLSEEYRNLLEAVLSVPLAIMSSVLHDVCATLTFRAAASAARELQMPPHRWRHHLVVSTSVARVQMGLRVNIWANAPLSRSTSATAGVAHVLDVATTGATAGAPVATNTPSVPVAAQEEQVSFIPPGSTVIPAVEVGIVNQQLVCVGDPSLEDQWLEARTQEHVGITVPELKFDASTVPVEAMLLDYAAGCSLVQLLRLQGFLQSEVQQQGWSMEHLEASMHVVHTHSSEPLEAAATDSDTTGNSGACRAAQTEQPTLRAEAGKDSKGAQDAAERRSQERERDVSRGVPVLVLRVRGQLGMSVSFDLVSGALCIHPGESNLPGQSFCTAVELERTQEQLRGIALGNAPIGTPHGPPLNMLAHALARFIIQRLLSTRAAVRAATALSLRLLPLTASPEGPTLPPYPESALRAYLRNSPTMSDQFPVHPTFLALPPSPLSLPLCQALMRRGLGRSTFKPHESIPRTRWQRMHFFIAIGLDPHGLNKPVSHLAARTGATPSPLSTHQASAAPHAGEHSTPASAAAQDHPQSSLVPPFRRARMSAALVCCIAGASSGVRAITLIEPVPQHVFSHAKKLLEDGLGANEVLAAVGAHGSTEPSGWFTKTLPDKPCGLSGRKRARADSDDAPMHATASTSVQKDAEDADVRVVHESGAAQKRSRVMHGPDAYDVVDLTDSPAADASVREASPGAPQQEEQQVQDREAGAAGTACEAPPKDKHASENCGWGSADFARERMEVALMTGWLQLRALTAYLVEELCGMGAEVIEHSAPSGSLNPCIPGVPDPRIILKTMWFSRTETFHFQAAEFVPWPQCIPHLPGMKLPEGSVADAAVRSVHIVVTSATTWELHIQSRLLAATLNALNADADAENKASHAQGSAHDSQGGAQAQAPTRKKQQSQRLWQWSADTPDYIVARYCTLRRLTATHCWQHILSAMSSLHKLNGFAALQHDQGTAKGAAGGDGTGMTEGATINGNAALHCAGTGVSSHGIAPIVYNFDVFEVTVKLISLDAMRVSVSRTKHITIKPVSTPVDTPGSSFATLAPSATPANPHVPIIEVEVAHCLENRVEATQASPPGSAPPQHSLVLFMHCRSHVVSGAGGSKPSPAAARGVHEAVSGALQRSELRLFLESLAYTSEGILSASRIASSIGVSHGAASSHTGTAKNACTGTETSPVIAALSRVKDIDVQTISSPFRYIIGISVATDGKTAKLTHYSVGLLLKSGGLALLQFDQRQFIVHKDLHDKMHAKMLQQQKASAAQSTLARMGTMREVPRYQELVRQLTSGAAPLACMAADVGAAWHAESPTAADVVIAQKDLHNAIELIAKFLDSTQLGSPT